MGEVASEADGTIGRRTEKQLNRRARFREVTFDARYQQIDPH